MDTGVWRTIDSSQLTDYSSSSPSLGSTGSPAVSSDASDSYVTIDQACLADTDVTYFTDVLKSLSENDSEHGDRSDICKSTKNKHEKAWKGPKIEKDADGKPQLPPCGVCGGTSSGFHFGVITCESCKVFFRRTLSKKPSYFCSRGDNCDIVPGKRSNCSFCRLKKCLQLGMSKDGVKKGRYTLERKHGYQDMVEHLEIEERRKQEEEDRQKEIHQQMIRDTTDSLILLYHRHKVMTPEVIERVRQGEQRRKEQKKAMEDAMGPTPSITPDEATEFFRTTGIDITGYRAAAKPCAETCPDYITAYCINYLKDLKEFMSLQLPDRITILKGAVNVWLWIATHEMLDIKEFTVTCVSCGNCMTEDQFRIFSSREEFESYFRPSIKLKEQNLTEVERAVLLGFVIFDTSQCTTELLEPEKVDLNQNLFLECLMYVLEENRGKENAAKTFGHIIHAITETRTCLNSQKQMMDKAAEIFSDVRYSRLMAEIYDLPECIVDDLGAGLDQLKL